MIISASQVLNYLEPSTSLKVVDMKGEDAFLADHSRILELVTAGQICGIVRGAKLKRLELIVPISETVTEKVRRETPGAINARTNIGAYRQHLETKSCWALCMSSV